MIVLPQNPHKQRYRRDRHSREHRDRIEAENRQRQRIGQMIASSEALRPASPITLPRISIQQQDAE